MKKHIILLGISLSMGVGLVSLSTKADETSTLNLNQNTKGMLENNDSNRLVKEMQEQAKQHNLSFTQLSTLLGFYQEGKVMVVPSPALQQLSLAIGAEINKETSKPIQIQMVLSSKKKKEVKHKNKKYTDIYYGNGVHVINGKVVMNWGQAWSGIGKIAVNGWVQHGPLAHL